MVSLPPIGCYVCALKVLGLPNPVLVKKIKFPKIFVVAWIYFRVFSPSINLNFMETSDVCPGVFIGGKREYWETRILGNAWKQRSGKREELTRYAWAVALQLNRTMKWQIMQTWFREVGTGTEILCQIFRILIAYFWRSVKFKRKSTSERLPLPYLKTQHRIFAPQCIAAGTKIKFFAHF